jgi:hypothetical protein
LLGDGLTRNDRVRKVFIYAAGRRGDAIACGWAAGVSRGRGIAEGSGGVCGDETLAARTLVEHHHAGHVNNRRRGVGAEGYGGGQGSGGAVGDGLQCRCAG